MLARYRQQILFPVFRLLLALLVSFGNINQLAASQVDNQNHSDVLSFCVCDSFFYAISGYASNRDTLSVHVVATADWLTMICHSSTLDWLIIWDILTQVLCVVRTAYSSHSVVLYSVAKRCKICPWCVQQSNGNLRFNFHLMQFLTPCAHPNFPNPWIQLYGLSLSLKLWPYCARWSRCYVGMER